MTHITPHIALVMDKLDFPEECVNAISEAARVLDCDTELAGSFDGAVSAYLATDRSDMADAVDAMTELSEKCGVNRYTLNLLFVLSCTEDMLNRYREKGISEDIYWDSVRDIRYKMLECVECRGAVGSFVPNWYTGFFKLNRFALGRFQFEKKLCDTEGGYTAKCGLYIAPGSPVLNFHIPSSGVSLTDEVRFDSYRRAYEFYADLFDGGPAVFCCGSWLLYPRHTEFLPSNSNVLRFMSDFEIIRSSEQETFRNDWRLFGRYFELPYSELPEDTSLRRAYKQWLVAGNKAGDGFGYIVFDGERILR